MDKKIQEDIGGHITPFCLILAPRRRRVAHTHELAAAHECRDPMEWPKTLKPSHHAKHYTRTKQPSQTQHDNKKSKAAGAATLPEGLLRI